MYALAVPESDYTHRVAVALQAAAYYRGMTTAQLAETVGVSVVTVRRWMRGERDMSISDASHLATVLDAPSDLLLRPPESRGAALAMMAAYDELRRSGAPPDPSPP